MTACRSLVGALILITAALGALLISPASAQSAPRTLTVDPAVGLDNRVVHVRWSGFAPANTVTLYQCKGVRPASVSDCYKDIAPPVTEFGTATDQATTGPDGRGDAELEVRPGLQLPQLGCSSRNPCSVVAFENDGSELPEVGLPATAVTARLDFAPSPSDCPKVSTPDVITAGEGSAAAALYSWSARVCSGSDPLSLDYTESSSPSGRDNFLKGLVDVGITSTAPTIEEIAAGSKRTFTEAPVDLTGVVVAFNVFDSVTHERITEMKLTPRLVALMIAGHAAFGGPGDSLFADPEFLALNPGHHWPENTPPPLLRSERNADTYVLTQWLNTDSAARSFLDGKDPKAEVNSFWKEIVYPTDVFESRDPTNIGSYNPRSSTLANARRLFNFQAPGDAAPSTAHDGLLGVMDAVTAEKFGLHTASLRPANVANGAFMAPDANGLTAGYRAMKAAPGGTTKVANSAAPGAYPLVKIDYALVPTSGATPAKARDIAHFLEYAANAGQGPGALSSGYLALPTDLRNQTAAAQRAVLAQKATQGPTTPQSPTSPSGAAPLATTPGSSSAPIGGSSFGPSTDSGATSLGTDGSSSSEGGSILGGSDGSGGSSGASGPGSGSADSSDASPTDQAAAKGEPIGGSSPQAIGVHGATLQPVGLFGGGEAQQVLPLLLGAGVVALAVGPSLSLWLRRKNRRATKAAAEPVIS